MNKKILALSLLSAMMLTALASCSGGSGDTATTTAGGADTTVADTTVAETTAEYVKPGVKFDGEEFAFAAWKTNSPNWIATSYCEIGAESLNGDLINDAIYERNAAVEEEYGIKIVQKGFQSSSEFLNPAMAGDSFADAGLLSGGTSKNFLNANLLIDLYTIDTLDLSKSWWNQTAADAFTIGGKLFFVPGNIGSFDNLSVYSVFFNKNMIESFSLDDPYTAVREGKWTIDMMKEHATVVASDLDGDGAMTEADRFGMSSEAAMVSPALRAAGINLTVKDDEDYPTLAVNTERSASVIEKIVPLWRDKATTLYVSDFSSKFGHVFSQFLVPHFIEDKLLYVNNWLCIALEMRDMNSDFGILPPPKFDEAQDAYYAASSESWTANATVPITNNRLEMTGYILDALGYYGQQYVQTALIDTTITDKALRDTDTEEMLQIIFDNRVFDIGSIFDWGGLYGTLSGFVSNNDTSFASKLASSESSIIGEMEKTIEDLKSR